MKTVLRSSDLSCPSCIAKIEKNLKQHDGVKAVDIRFNSGRILVEHDETAISDTRLAEIVSSIGYKTEVSSI